MKSRHTVKIPKKKQNEPPRQEPPRQEPPRQEQTRDIKNKILEEADAIDNKFINTRSMYSAILNTGEKIPTMFTNMLFNLISANKGLLRPYDTRIVSISNKLKQCYDEFVNTNTIKNMKTLSDFIVIFHDSLYTIWRQNYWNIISFQNYDMLFVLCNMFFHDHPDITTTLIEKQIIDSVILFSNVMFALYNYHKEHKYELTSESYTKDVNANIVLNENNIRVSFASPFESTIDVDKNKLYIEDTKDVNVFIEDMNKLIPYNFSDNEYTQIYNLLFSMICINNGELHKQTQMIPNNVVNRNKQCHGKFINKLKHIYSTDNLYNNKIVFAILYNLVCIYQDKYNNISLNVYLTMLKSLISILFYEFEAQDNLFVKCICVYNNVLKELLTYKNTQISNIIVSEHIEYNNTVATMFITLDVYYDEDTLITRRVGIDLKTLNVNTTNITNKRKNQNDYKASLQYQYSSALANHISSNDINNDVYKALFLIANLSITDIIQPQYIADTMNNDINNMSYAVWLDIVKNDYINMFKRIDNNDVNLYVFILYNALDTLYNDNDFENIIDRALYYETFNRLYLDGPTLYTYAGDTVSRLINTVYILCTLLYNIVDNDKQITNIIFLNDNTYNITANVYYNDTNTVYNVVRTSLLYNLVPIDEANYKADINYDDVNNATINDTYDLSMQETTDIEKIIYVIYNYVIEYIVKPLVDNPIKFSEDYLMCIFATYIINIYQSGLTSLLTRDDIYNRIDTANKKSLLNSVKSILHTTNKLNMFALIRALISELVKESIDKPYVIKIYSKCLYAFNNAITNGIYSDANGLLVFINSLLILQYIIGYINTNIQDVNTIRKTLDAHINITNNEEHITMQMELYNVLTNTSIDLQTIDISNIISSDITNKRYIQESLAKIKQHFDNNMFTKTINNDTYYTYGVYISLLQHVLNDEFNKLANLHSVIKIDDDNIDTFIDYIIYTPYDVLILFIEHVIDYINKQLPIQTSYSNTSYVLYVVDYVVNTLSVFVKQDKYINPLLLPAICILIVSIILDNYIVDRLAYNELENIAANTSENLILDLDIVFASSKHIVFDNMSLFRDIEYCLYAFDNEIEINETKLTTLENTNYKLYLLYASTIKLLNVYKNDFTKNYTFNALVGTPIMSTDKKDMIRETTNSIYHAVIRHVITMHSANDFNKLLMLEHNILHIIDYVKHNNNMLPVEVNPILILLVLSVVVNNKHADIAKITTDIIKELDGYMFTPTDEQINEIPGMMSNKCKQYLSEQVSEDAITTFCKLMHYIITNKELSTLDYTKTIDTSNDNIQKVFNDVIKPDDTTIITQHYLLNAFHKYVIKSGLSPYYMVYYMIYIEFALGVLSSSLQYTDNFVNIVVLFVCNLIANTYEVIDKAKTFNIARNIKISLDKHDNDKFIYIIYYNRNGIKYESTLPTALINPTYYNNVIFNDVVAYIENKHVNVLNKHIVDMNFLQYYYANLLRFLKHHHEQKITIENLSNVISMTVAHKNKYIDSNLLLKHVFFSVIHDIVYNIVFSTSFDNIEQFIYNAFDFILDNNYFGLEEELFGIMFAVIVFTGIEDHNIEKQIALTYNDNIILVDNGVNVVEINMDDFYNNFSFSVNKDVDELIDRVKKAMPTKTLNMKTDKSTTELKVYAHILDLLYKGNVDKNIQKITTTAINKSITNNVMTMEEFDITTQCNILYDFLCYLLLKNPMNDLYSYNNIEMFTINAVKYMRSHYFEGNMTIINVIMLIVLQMQTLQRLNTTKYINIKSSTIEDKKDNIIVNITYDNNKTTTLSKPLVDIIYENDHYDKFYTPLHQLLIPRANIDEGFNSNLHLYINLLEYERIHTYDTTMKKQNIVSKSSSHEPLTFDEFFNRYVNYLYEFSKYKHYDINLIASLFDSCLGFLCSNPYFNNANKTTKHVFINSILLFTYIIRTHNIVKQVKFIPKWIRCKWNDIYSNCIEYVINGRDKYTMKLTDIILYNE